MAEPLLLIADDDRDAALAVANVFQSSGWRCRIETDGTAARNAIQLSPFGLVITEQVLTGIGGLELLRWIRRQRPAVPVVIHTAYPSIEAAVAAMKTGAAEYLIKPVEKEQWRILAERFIADAQELAQTSDRAGLPFFTRQQELAKLYRAIVEKIAQTDTTVLIQGESGTGKEVMASLIHHHSPRRSAPFIKVSCAAIPETLLESELFGYEKGAFTGAVKQRHGRFELAQRGTLFLDEVGDMPLAVQAKLLRAVQERTIERLGGERVIPVDVRLIAATWRNLADEIKLGTFREDLYYRLNVILLKLPPLRERMEDFTPLAMQFIERYCRRFGKPHLAVSPQAMAAMQQYDWPGNIRELENVLERGAVMASNDIITPEDLGEPLLTIARKSAPELALPSLKEARRHFEREFIRNVLLKCDGSVSQAASLLKIARKNLYEKITQLGIDLEVLRTETSTQTFPTAEIVAAETPSLKYF